MNIIDFRSDTVTRPTQAMRQTMFDAPLGDDVFGDDPSINALEEKVAKLFNKDAALFCSSGTLTNQIAIKAHTQPSDELICDRLSHIYCYEGGGIAFNSGVQSRLIHSAAGVFTPEAVLENINTENVHYPHTKLVCIENTVNKGGGKIWELEQMQAIREVCNQQQLALHLDGARLFNAIVERNYTTQDIGNTFHSISICLSKGLGCPVGSLLIGDKAFIHKARRIRKVLGGGMRQAGFLAAAGSYALEHHIDRLKEDHRRAKQIEQLLTGLPFIESIVPVTTNIVLFKLNNTISENQFLQHLQLNHIAAMQAGPKTIRFVTHLDIDDLGIERLLDAVKKLN
jgi:threonine aldolase